MSGIFMPIEGAEGRERNWFHRLANAREDPSAVADAKVWLLQRLAAVPLASAAEILPGGGLDPASLEEVGRSQAGSDSPEGDCAPHTAGPELLAFHAPLALLEGAWLQSVARAGNTCGKTAAGLFSAYLALLGRDEAASPAFAYRGRLAALGVCLPGTSAWRFAHDRRTGPPAMAFCSLQLALGLHASILIAETLGFTLAYLHSHSPWRSPCLPDKRRREMMDAMQSHTESALKASIGEAVDWEGVRRGYALYRLAEADYLAALDAEAQRTDSLDRQVGEIFDRKRRFAMGYHAGVMVGDRRLEEWFGDLPFDPHGFLAAFADSPFLRGKKGERLFDRLLAFGGPMFGVFDSDEMALIDRWLAELEHRRLDGLPPSNPGESGIGWCGRSDTAADNPAGEVGALPATRAGPCGNICNRSLFHRLLNAEPLPDALEAGRRLVARILSRSRRSLSRNGSWRERFFDYSPGVFADRIAHIHEQEVARHKPFRPPPRLGREEYIWGIRQFAPSILVDGCWLQHLGEAANQDKRPLRLLHRIHAEELGEGRIERNHPKIYRDLLDALGIDLPSVETEEFSRDPGFLDTAFDLPAYLLSISQFPRSRLPELMGLNLAIEMSGLGAGYMRLAEELRYHNIDPLIVTLHLSIDNLAGGHAAMAAEAIELYLDEIRQLAGDDAMQETWRRIWAGYLSLNAATRRFRIALVLGFCRRFLPHRVLAALRKAG